MVVDCPMDRTYYWNFSCVCGRPSACNIVDINSITGVQQHIFVAVDILITGSVLAGGSEAFNKIMKIYNNIMNSTAEKVKKTPQ